MVLACFQIFRPLNKLQTFFIALGKNERKMENFFCALEYQRPIDLLSNHTRRCAIQQLATGVAAPKFLMRSYQKTIKGKRTCLTLQTQLIKREPLLCNYYFFAKLICF